MLLRRKIATSQQLMINKRLKSGKSGIKPSVLAKLDEGFAKLMASKSKSLLKKYLTPELFKALRTKRTKYSTLLDCIQSGLKNHDAECGVYAPDAEAYSVFADLFNPIIKEYHGTLKNTDKHPCPNFGNPCLFGDLDPFKHYIASTRVRCARCIRGYPFVPVMTEKELDHVEDLIHCTLFKMGNEFKGGIHRLFGLKRQLKQKLIKDHFLYKSDDRFLLAANAFKHFPTGRSVYYNLDKNFIAWCNHKDHLRMVSMQRGGDVGAVFGRLVRAIYAMEATIRFERDDRLGYLTFSPADLGTTFRISMHIRLPKLSPNKKKLKALAEKFEVNLKEVKNGYMYGAGEFFEIWNKQRIGFDEYQIVKGFVKAIREIICLERSEKGPAAQLNEGKKVKS